MLLPICFASADVLKNGWILRKQGLSILLLKQTVFISFKGIWAYFVKKLMLHDLGSKRFLYLHFQVLSKIWYIISPEFPVTHDFLENISWIIFSVFCFSQT